TSGWGWVTFSIGAVALVLEARRDERIRRALACFVISVAAVLATLNPDYWFARFVLFFPAIAVIAAAGYAEGCRPASWAIAAGARPPVLRPPGAPELPPGATTN